MNEIMFSAGPLPLILAAVFVFGAPVYVIWSSLARAEESPLVIPGEPQSPGTRLDWGAGYTCYVAGQWSHDGRRRVHDGLQAFLVAEPDNPYDPDAIRVETADGIHVGYIRRESAFNLLRAWRERRRLAAVFYRLDSGAVAVRVWSL